MDEVAAFSFSGRFNVTVATAPATTMSISLAAGLSVVFTLATLKRLVHRARRLSRGRPAVPPMTTQWVQTTSGLVGCLVKPRSHALLPTDELWLATLTSCGDTFAEVRCGEQQTLLVNLTRNRLTHLLQQGVAHGVTDRANRQRRRTCDVGGQRQRGTHHAVRSGRQVDQPHRSRLRAVERLPGVQQLCRSCPTDSPRQGDAEAEALVDPEPGKISAYPRVTGCHPEVSSQRKPQAAADDSSMQTSNQRKRLRKDTQSVSVQLFDIDQLPLAIRIQHSEVRARAEVLPGGPDDHSTCCPISADGLQGVGESPNHLQREEVGGRPLEGDDSDMPCSTVDVDAVVAHAITTTGFTSSPDSARRTASLISSNGWSVTIFSSGK